jgi:hypothetical protein
MQLNEQVKQQRWAMLTNPYTLPVPPMCKATFREVAEHMQMIDLTTAINGGKQASDSDMRKMLERFQRFCDAQWLNRSRD